MLKYMYCGPRARYTQYVSQYIAIHRNTILVIHVLQGARTIHARQSQYTSQYTAIHVARVYLASRARYKCNTCRRHAQYHHNTLAIHVLRPALLDDPLAGDYLFLLHFILLCFAAAGLALLCFAAADLLLGLDWVLGLDWGRFVRQVVLLAVALVAIIWVKALLDCPLAPGAVEGL